MRQINSLILSLHALTVPIVRPRIVRTFDHDPLAFTQGLAFVRGRLFESTGGNGTSTLRELDPANGSVLRQRGVDHHFAEGLCLHEGSLYQLTWTTGRVFRYDPDTLESLGEFQIAHEGWGIASAHGSLWVSNGSSLVHRYDSGFNLLESMRVSNRLAPIRHLNAMCAIGARVLANIWYSHWVAEFDPLSGSLTRMIDCRELVASEAPSNHHHILNGIAKDDDRGTWYLTGKHWKRCFEVEIPGPA